MNWKIGAHLKRLKHYIIAMTIVFGAGVAMGWSDEGQFRFFIDQMLAQLEQLAGKVDQENTEWSLFWLIFLNNTRAALVMIVTGIFFGLVPISSLLLNGITIGYVAGVMAEQQSVGAVLQTLLPHALLELPAIIIASALGLRFGVLVIKLFVMLFAKSRAASIMDQWKQFAGSIVPMFLFITVVLLGAAVIESTISYWLASQLK